MKNLLAQFPEHESRIQAHQQRIAREIEILVRHNMTSNTVACKADIVLGRPLDILACILFIIIHRMRTRQGLCECCGVRKTRLTKTGRWLTQCSICHSPKYLKMNLVRYDYYKSKAKKETNNEN